MVGIYEYLEHDLEQVEARLRERTASTYDLVDVAIQHVISSGGKRLRPIMVLLSARSVGHSEDAMYELAAAIEMIHVASLVHDDVIDDAARRRGNPTLNVRFGSKVAVLVGDYLHARVLSMLIDCGASAAILSAVSEATQAMCEGEVIHAYKAGDFELDLDDYIKIIERKTATLISCCCRVGSLLGSADSEQVAALSSYGTAVGIAFQIADDVLDIVGEPTKFGKPPRNDLREGKLTLPVMYTRDCCSPDERARLEGLFRADARSDEDLLWIVRLAERYDAIQYSLGMAEDFSRQSKDMLATIPDSRARRSLAELADYVVAREH